MAAVIRIGSRPSALALAQAELVRERLARAIAKTAVEVVPIRTSGDRLASASLAQVGGKGLFVKELEQALLERRIELAVHSLKDMPAVLAPAFRIAAVTARENPRDALVLPAGAARPAAGAPLNALRRGARVGTSSSRRRFEALRLRPDLEVIPTRGNVDTRLNRLAKGELDALILAIAGLRRLGRLESLNYVELDERDFVPCAGQGALAIETLEASASGEIADAVISLADAAATAETCAERAFLATIHASCVSPVGVKGDFKNGRLKLTALLFSLDGARSMADRLEAEQGNDATAAHAAELGRRLGERMIKGGAHELLQPP